MTPERASGLRQSTRELPVPRAPDAMCSSYASNAACSNVAAAVAAAVAAPSDDARETHGASFDAARVVVCARVCDRVIGGRNTAAEGASGGVPQAIRWQAAVHVWWPLLGLSPLLAAPGTFSTQPRLTFTGL